MDTKTSIGNVFMSGGKSDVISESYLGSPSVETISDHEV